MPNLSEIANGKAKAITTLSPNRNRSISGRRYDIVGYKTDGTVTRKDNVSANKANAVRQELRNEGHYRVDKLEVISKVVNSNYESVTLTFVEKNYVAPDNAIVAREGDVTDIQKTFAWDAVSTGDDAWLNPEASHIAEGHRKAHAQAIAKASRKSTSKETRTDLLTAHHKMTGMVDFVGTEEEMIFFLNNLKEPMGNYVFYVPNDIHKKAVANDE